MKKILYIGNNLSKQSKYATSLDILSERLQKSGYQVLITSDKSNKWWRMLDMIKTFISNLSRILIMP